MMKFPAFLASALALAASAAPAQTALRAAPSTRGTAEVVLTFPRDRVPADTVQRKIRLDYGQPHLRGRRLHTDSLVPYDSTWRTGANAPTTLTSDVDLTLGGIAIPKGAYTVVTLPTRAGWRLILQASVPNPSPNTPPREIARMDLRRTEATTPLESLTMWLIPSTAAGNQRGELRIAWGNFVLSTDWAVR